MPTSTTCRVCLSSNLRLNRIENTELLNIFEKLTNLKVPGAMCVLCVNQLRRCSKFATMARQVHYLLSDVADKGLEASAETLARLNVQQFQVLSISHPQSMHTLSIHHNDKPDVKQEVSVKLEITSLDTEDNIEDGDDAENIEDDTKSLKNVEVKKPCILEKVISDKEILTSNKDIIRDRPKMIKKVKIKAIRKKMSKTKHTYTCEFCKKVYTRRNEMLVHRRIHTGERPFSCEQCSKSFTSASNLTAHKITHIPIVDRPRTHSCHQCGKTFFDKVHLRLHSQIHSEKKYVCKICGSSFSMPTRLKNHMVTHSNERTHSCDRCAKSFKTLKVLRDHLLGHSGVKRHSCEHCEKSFTRRHELILHLRVHTGEKPYACHVCGKSFSQSSTLRTHIVIHSEDRPFECDICGSKFKDKYTLGKHGATHAAGPPCACAVCGREYSTQRGAAAHARSHARARVPCDKCGKTFSNAAHLKRHERNVRCVAREAPVSDG